MHQGPSTPPPQPITPPPMPMYQGPPQPHMQPPMQPHMQGGPPPTRPPMMAPPPPRQSSSAGPLIAVFGCLGVLLLVVVIVVVAIAAGSDDDDPPISSDTTYTPPSFSPPTGSSSRAPEVIDGTWKGTAFQPNARGDKSYTVEYRLFGGLSIGRVTYSGATTSCSGSMIVQPGGTTTKVTYKVTRITGDCIDVYATFYPTGGSTMRFEEREALTGTPDVTGVLTKEPGS